LTEAGSDPRRISGTIIRTHGSHYLVESDDGERWQCVLRGRHRLAGHMTTNPVTIGDRVDCVSADGADGEAQGAIEEIHPRRTRISRTAPGELPREQVLAANVDAVAVVFAFCRPRPNFRLVQRLLLAAAVGGAEPLLLLNKLDLAKRRDLREVEPMAAVLERAGYPVLRTAAAAGDGVEELRAWMVQRVVAFVGPSGAGKSSLANALDPGLGLRVGAVSKRTGRGRHTTTWGELVRLAGGARLVDTPGIGALDVWGVEPEELILWLPDLRPYAGACEWRNCDHRPEERECALVRAAAEGRIDARRLAFFRETLALLEARREVWERSGGEGARPEEREEWGEE
jgi:ribosome biogenesis GTPase